MIVDAHQHFWDPATADYPWMTDDLRAVGDTAPDDLAPLLRRVRCSRNDRRAGASFLRRDAGAARDRRDDTVRARRRRLGRPRRRRGGRARRARGCQTPGARRARSGLASPRRRQAWHRRRRRGGARVRPARARAAASGRSRDGAPESRHEVRARSRREASARRQRLGGRCRRTRRAAERHVQALRPVDRVRRSRNGRARARVVRRRPVHVRLGLAGVPARRRIRRSARPRRQRRGRPRRHRNPGRTGLVCGADARPALRHVPRRPPSFPAPSPTRRRSARRGLRGRVPARPGRAAGSRRSTPAIIARRGAARPAIRTRVLSWIFRSWRRRAPARRW